jgi:hypothetical protein
MTTHTVTTPNLRDDTDWQALLTHLPAALDRTAFQFGALYRRRAFKCAADLLRLILAYACGLPLLTVVTWAHNVGLATLTDEALDARIRQADAWLAWLLTQVLAALAGVPAALPLTVRLADTTLISRPGATQPDWRAHLTFNLQQMRLDMACLTEHTQGDALARSQPQAGELVIGDRGFCARTHLWAVIQTGAWVLVRLAHQHLPLATRTGAAFDLLAEACRALAPGETQEWATQTVAHGAIPALAGRLVVTRLPDEQAEAARERLRKSRRKAGTRKGVLSAEALELAGYVALWTNLPATLASTATVAALYRFRWQVELAIKRYKQLCALARLTARHADLCRATLLAKLLLLVLTEDLGAHAEAFSPSAGPDGAGNPPVERLARAPARVAESRAGDYPGAGLSPLGHGRHHRDPVLL